MAPVRYPSVYFVSVVSLSVLCCCVSLFIVCRFCDVVYPYLLSVDHNSWAFAAMDTNSATVSTVSGITIPASSSTWRPYSLSIRTIRLNGINYPPWAKFVEVYKGRISM